MALRTYSGTAKRTALTGDITAASTSFTVADATGYPSPTTGQGPFVVTLKLGQSGEEKLLIASRSGNTFTVAERGFDGTAPAAHGAGVTVDHTLSATDIREVNEFANAPGGYVSGAGGSTITAATATTRGLVVKGAAGQTANLAEFQDSAGTLLTSIVADGTTIVRTGLAVGPSAASGAIFATTRIAAAAPGTPVLGVRGAAGQTANLAEWQNSAGAVLAKVDTAGSYVIESDSGGLGAPGRSTFGGAADYTATISVLAGRIGGVGAKGLVVRGSAGQTGNLVEFQNSAGAAIAVITATGSLQTQRAQVNGTTDANLGKQVAVFDTGAADVRGLTVRGAAGQTANLAEFQNSAGTVLASVDSGGGISTGPAQIASSNSTSFGLFVRSTAAGHLPLFVRGAAGQTANLAEFQRADGVLLAYINKDGVAAVLDKDGQGTRELRFGLPDSAGAGFRTVRVIN